MDGQDATCEAVDLGLITTEEWAHGRLHTDWMDPFETISSTGALNLTLPHTCCLTLAATHMLRIDTHLVEEDLDDQLRRFWVLESLAIMKDELSV